MGCNVQMCDGMECLMVSLNGMLNLSGSFATGRQRQTETKDREHADYIQGEEGQS